MRDGVIFVPMSEVIFSFLNALFGEGFTVNFMFLVGGIGTFFLMICMPIRICWHIYKVIKRENIYGESSSWFAIFLFLSIAGTVEVYYVLSQVGPASSAGMLLPLYLFFPFLFYMIYEIVMYKLKISRNNKVVK